MGFGGIVRFIANDDPEIYGGVAMDCAVSLVDFDVLISIER